MQQRDDDLDPLAPTHYPSPGETESDLDLIAPAAGFGARNGESPQPPHREEAMDEDAYEEFVPAADFGSAEPEAEVDADQPPSDGSVSDPDNIVRVWLEPTGRVQKVRISPQWHSKLRGRPLGQPVTGAFVLAGVATLMPSLEQQPTMVEDLDVELDPKRLPRFTVDAFGALVSLMNQTSQRIDQAMEQREETADTITEAEPVTARVKGVTVQVGEDGLVDQVSFDEGWLDEAQAGMIGQTIVQAAHQAQDRFEQSKTEQHQDDELVGLMQERELYLTALKTMMNPKERR